MNSANLTAAFSNVDPAHLGHALARQGGSRGRWVRATSRQCCLRCLRHPDCHTGHRRPAQQPVEEADGDVPDFNQHYCSPHQGPDQSLNMQSLTATQLIVGYRVFSTTKTLDKIKSGRPAAPFSRISRSVQPSSRISE